MSSATTSRQTLKKPAPPQASARPSASSLLLQRKSAEGDAAGMDEECDECKKGLGVQRLASRTGGPAVAPPIVHEVLRSPGQPLDAGTRAFMEPRFGHDFSRVRVHADASAARSARDVNARAYTVGQEVVFAENQYAPGYVAGTHLLAHELSHVIQQENVSAPADSNLSVGEPNDPLERQADQMAASVLQGPADSGAVSPTMTHGRTLSWPAIQRQVADPLTAPPAMPNSTARPELSQGSTDPSVMQAQHELNLVHAQRLAKGMTGLPNCPLAEDSIFGPKTSGAVIAFQQQAFPGDPGEWDGIVGPHTWAALGVTSVGDQNDGDVTNQIPESSTAAVAPASLRSAIGSPDYYIKRASDFTLRNPGQKPPDYYYGYGYKYAKRFLVSLGPNLSAAGQAWLDCTLIALQTAIENLRDSDIWAFAKLEQDNDKFRRFAYGTHSDAYVSCGVCYLSIFDDYKIVNEPDFSDLSDFNGVKQIVDTLLQCATRDLILIGFI